MEFKKYTPPESKKAELLSRITDEDYAQSLIATGDGVKHGTLFRYLLTAAAMLVVAVGVTAAALIGREIFHGKKSVAPPADEAPASAPECENFVFMEGTFLGTVKDGAYNNDGFYTGRTFAELLAHDCLYADNGIVYREIYFDTANATDGYYSDLEKYAAETGTGYIKFALPTVIDEGEAANKCIPRHAIAFFDSLRNDSGIVCTAPIDRKLLDSYSSELTDAEKQTLYEEYDINTGLVESVVYSTDFDGDGSNEKLVQVFSSPLASSIPFEIICILDKEEIKHILHESGFGQLTDRDITAILDVDMNGSCEFIIRNQSTDKLSYVMYGYGGQVFEPVEKEMVTIDECFYMFNDLLIENAFSDEVVTNEWYGGRFGDPITRQVLLDMTETFFTTYGLELKSIDMPDSLDKDSLTKYINKIGDNLYIDLPDSGFAIVNGEEITGDDLTRLINYIENTRVEKLSVRPVATGGTNDSIAFFTDGGEPVTFDYTRSALMSNSITYTLPTDCLAKVYDHNRDFSGDVYLDIDGKKVTLSKEDAETVRAIVSGGSWHYDMAKTHYPTKLVIGDKRLGYELGLRLLPCGRGSVELTFSASQRLSAVLENYIN